MTKEEAIKFLTNKKVYVNGESAKIQEKLLKLGFRWAGDIKNICNIHKPFLFISDKKISDHSDMISFKIHQYTEISAEDILSIKIEEKCPFKTFDKVLVRDTNDQPWKINLFSHYKEGQEYPFVTMIGVYKQCVSYEGNEHLVDTTKDE